jgi:COP9 signalosome complex subunit 5
MSSNTAFKTFSLANDILTIPPEDEIFKFDADANRKLNREAPWSKECVRVCVTVLH